MIDVRTVTVAEFKRRFSELVADVRYRRERILVTRRETPMAALVGLEDLERLSREAPVPRNGLLAAIGAWDDDDELDRIVKEIYAARDHAADRPASFPE